MDVGDYLRFILALVFVLALIGLLSWAVRRYGLGGRLAASASGGRRLRVIEVASLDAKHRLVLVSRDRVEHLVLIGGPNDLVVETGIVGGPGPDPESDPGPSPEKRPAENAS